MPITPPNLDDRRYDDIVREARALIPQYCPEWTNLGDADPGMTLVQLFAWMTEMTIFRLNRVPDKTYVHFLNFIGEERRGAIPAQVAVSFFPRNEGIGAVELPPFTRCSTRQESGRDALHYLTTDALTVHSATVERMVAVQAGAKHMVRELPFQAHPSHKGALLFNRGSGVHLFRMDPIEHGPRAYTPDQFLYVSHDDFRLMLRRPDPGQKTGRVRMRAANEENLPVAGLFVWEFYTKDEEWRPVLLDEEDEEVLGLPEITLQSVLFRIDTIDSFGVEDDPFPKPKELDEERYWIRGRVDYERWLAHRMMSDLEITWRDDRGGEERLLTNWDVRDTGRNIEFFVQDMPPIRPGWTLRFTMVDRSMPAGRNAYFPRYRWSYRRGDKWEAVAMERVRYQGTSIILTGPFTDMATDGFNLRAERIETVNVRGFVPELALELTWLRPVELHLAYGPETTAAAPIQTHDLPQLPFQPAPTLPPLLGMKFFIGSDLFENRAQKPVMLELEVGFELDSEAIEEPRELYHMQFAYRAADSWRVVHDEDNTFSQFTFADLDPEGALVPGRRKIRILLDPKVHLRGLFRSELSQVETCWLRLELTKSAMTFQADKKEPPKPIALKIHAVKLGVEGIIGKDVYEQPMPGVKTATVEYREHNRRLSRAITRTAGRLTEHHPFDDFIDIADSIAPKDDRDQGHQALYMQLDKALPVGRRHAMMFKTRGEAYLPEGLSVSWEVLEDAGFGRTRWRRLTDDEGAYRMERSGVLEFPINDPWPVPPAGPWMRALFRAPEGEEMPSFPPVSHLMMNTVDSVNLHEFRMEKFSGEGIPHQTIQLRRFPVYLHPDDAVHNAFSHPDRFPGHPGLRHRRRWREARMASGPRQLHAHLQQGRPGVRHGHGRGPASVRQRHPRPHDPRGQLQRRGGGLPHRSWRSRQHRA